MARGALVRPPGLQTGLVVPEERAAGGRRARGCRPRHANRDRPTDGSRIGCRRWDLRHECAHRPSATSAETRPWLSEEQPTLVERGPVMVTRRSPDRSARPTIRSRTCYPLSRVPRAAERFPGRTAAPLRPIRRKRRRGSGGCPWRRERADDTSPRRSSCRYRSPSERTGLSQWPTDHLQPVPQTRARPHPTRTPTRSCSRCSRRSRPR